MTRPGCLPAVAWAALALGCSSSPAPSAGSAAAEPALTSLDAATWRSVVDSAPTLVDELDFAGRRWVDQTLASLTLEEQVGQLVIPWIPGSYASTSSADFLELEHWVEDLGLGGVSISIGLPHTYAAKLNELQRRAKVPLLVTSDFENGGPGMRINHSYALPSLLPQGGGTSFPPTMSFGAIGDERWAYEYGRVTGLEARAVGVHMIFAPVLDVNSNPANPIINTRSFGEDPAAVARLGLAFMRGARSAGVFTTAKHFPGHGDTETDSHLSLPAVTADQDRLERVELVPFRAAVDAGVDAVMTAHVAVPGILGEGAPPATMSPYFMTRLLREDMGFSGVLFTDALRMGAISDAYGGAEAAVLALEAGADVILAPEDVESAVRAVVEAVQSGRIQRQRVQESTKRILELKARAGLHERRFVDFESVDEVVGRASHLALADSAASRAITLVRDDAGILPVPIGPDLRVLSLTYARPTAVVAGTIFDAELAGYVGDLVTARVDESTTAETYDSLRAVAEGVDLVLVGAYVPPRAGAGSVEAPESMSAFVQDIADRRPTMVVSLGNPYLLSDFPSVPGYMVAWGSREVSQRAAVRALFGAAPITGRLPISLPPFHRAGHGLDRPAVAGVSSVAAGVDPLAQAGILPGRRAAARASGRAAGGRVQAARVRVSPLEAQADEAGMSEEVLSRLDSLVLASIDDSVAPGVALAVGRRGRLVRLRGYGRLDWAEDAAPATPSSIWDLASLTKVVGTTTAAMLLVEDGRLDLDAPVIRYLSWWADGDPRKRDVSVRQLLLHRAGLPPFRRFFLEMEGTDAYRRAIGGLSLDYAPGDSTVYSDIGLMTVGFIVEAISGQSLDAFLEQEVWGPLGMRDTGFRPDSTLRARIAPTEIDTAYRGRLVHGEVHDENAFAIGGVAGHAGLFSSARDLAVFASMMLGNGRAEACDPAPGLGRACSAPRAAPLTLLNASTIRLFTGRYDEGASRALGWDTPSGVSSAGRYFSARAFGHTGFTGTSIWMDPESDLFVVLLTNRVNPTRANTRHVPFRRAVHDLVATAVRDTPIRPREGGS